VPNELLIHACSPQSAKVIIITFAQWQMNCCKAGEAYLVAGDALSGWSGDARDWWLGNLLDLLIFLLDFFFLPGLSFFFLGSLSPFLFCFSFVCVVLSVFVSVFLFFSPVSVFRFSVVLWFSVCLPVRSVRLCYVLSAFAPLFSFASPFSSSPSVVAFLWIL